MHVRCMSAMGLARPCLLQGLLQQCRRVLKPDGLLLSCMMGGTSWQELRISCSLAEMEREGGVSPRVSPMVKVCQYIHILPFFSRGCELVFVFVCSAFCFSLFATCYV